ncbi:hypothetical protein QO010_001738 [Caulobacter ginsengisoli]|uniref:Uncharacterized protein n=1 Tax=Caulobacter ginsengisoli TaxID=400775 RepID=A0ABU0ISP1_9CAUL|nr:hypothetical protein [Caulobacter ginsengisoli]MDQ0463967.1 hypothetical protein [Caulobacter ginsengisoli]
MPDTLTKTRPETKAAVTPAASPSILQINPPLPTAPEIRALAGDIQARLKLAFAMAAAGRTPAGAKGGDELFARIVASRPAAGKQRLQAKARAMLDAPRATRESFFGRYGAVEPARYTGLAMVHASVGPVAVDGKKLKAALEAVGKNDAARMHLEAVHSTASEVKIVRKKQPQDTGQKSAAQLDAEAGAKFKHLSLYLNKVKCLNTTDGEAGSDEIAMGGTATNPSGETTKISQFLVYDDFDKDDRRAYGGAGKRLHRWNIPVNNNWPHTYAAVLVMAEKDEGGFGDFLKALWDYIDEEVKSAVAGAVGAAIGAALGSFFGPLGTALGALTGILVGLFIDWLIGLFEDDLIAARTIILYLGAATKSYYDQCGLTADPAPRFTIDYNGDGGHYRTWFSLAVEA